MVYTAKSEYEYITGDELEAYAITTYATVSAKYTETAVMAQVTAAEELVNVSVDPSLVPFTAGNAPSGIKLATKIMARRFMELQMVQDGWMKPEEIKFTKIYDEIVELALGPYGYNPVDSIPMQGIDRYSNMF